MRTPHRLFVLVALLASGAPVWYGQHSPAQEKGKEKGDVPPVPKWEYKVVGLEKDDAAAEKELNKLGDEGWELVGTPSSVSSPHKQDGGGGISTKVRLILKRQKR